MAQDDLLMPVPLPPLAQEGLATSFNLIRLWEERDPEAALAAIAPGLRRFL
jgi:hypothetical protein